ncbi:MAG: hypothetical protein EXX96DRAFT_454939, partial [Benjaminiella poitrasii]
EGKRQWYELRFLFKNVGIIATGGLSNSTNNKDGLYAFLGMTAPTVLAFGNKYILFSPVYALNSMSCPRILRNY